MAADVSPVGPGLQRKGCATLQLGLFRRNGHWVYHRRRGLALAGAARTQPPLGPVPRLFVLLAADRADGAGSRAAPRLAVARNLASGWRGGAGRVSVLLLVRAGDLAAAYWQNHRPAGHARVGHLLTGAQVFWPVRGPDQVFRSRHCLGRGDSAAGLPGPAAVLGQASA